MQIFCISTCFQKYKGDQEVYSIRLTQQLKELFCVSKWMGRGGQEQNHILGIGFIQLLNIYLIQWLWWFEQYLVFNKNSF